MKSKIGKGISMLGALLIFIATICVFIRCYFDIVELILKIDSVPIRIMAVCFPLGVILICIGKIIIDSNDEKA